MVEEPQKTAERRHTLRRAFDAQALAFDQLTEVSLALSSERDFRKLLDLIVSRAMLLTGCDAGSLYLMAPGEAEGAPPHLLFAAARNHSVCITFKEAELAVTTESLAGYVAATGEPLIIEDAYAIPSRAPYRFNRTFDEEGRYRTKSLLILPMKTPAGEITGVLQLLNRKRDPSAVLDTPAAAEAGAIPFDEATTRMGLTVGSLAAVAIDNHRLYESIERLFEGFVSASMAAIEQRDPSTSGHSLRVARMAVALAESVNGEETGALSAYRFTRDQLRELRYASLLHDFGKVGVRENVLTKSKKLYPHALERILTRLETAHLLAERDMLLCKVKSLESGVRDAALFERLDAELARSAGDLDRVRDVVLRSNEPTILPDGDFGALQALADASFVDRLGEPRPLVSPDEIAILSIRKGSLSEQERAEIESHAAHTYHFLREIPWTQPLRNVPSIAYGHHEKLNGTGYPRGLRSGEIPIQARIMAVADVYDALSAADRPYKKAAPVERALDILRMEVQDGFLDGDLVDLFIRSKIYQAAAADSTPKRE